METIVKKDIRKQSIAQIKDFLAEHKDILPNCAVYGTDSSPIGAIRDDNGAIIGVKQLVRYR